MGYEIEVRRPYDSEYNLPNTYQVEHLAEAKAFISQVMDLVEYAVYETEIIIKKTYNNNDDEETKTP